MLKGEAPPPFNISEEEGGLIGWEQKGSCPWLPASIRLRRNSFFLYCNHITFLLNSIFGGNQFGFLFSPQYWDFLFRTRPIFCQTWWLRTFENYLLVESAFVVRNSRTLFQDFIIHVFLQNTLSSPDKLRFLLKVLEGLLHKKRKDKYNRPGWANM